MADIHVESTTDTDEQVEAAAAHYAPKQQTGAETGDAQQGPAVEPTTPDDDSSTDPPTGEDDAGLVATEGTEPEDDDSQSEADGAEPKKRPISKSQQRRLKIQRDIADLTREKYRTLGELETLQQQRDRLQPPPHAFTPPHAPQGVPGQPPGPGQPPQAAQPPEEPQHKDFDTFEEYDKAWRSWMKESRDALVAAQVDAKLQEQRSVDAQAQQQAAARQNFEQLVANTQKTAAEARKRHPDFDEVTQAGGDLPLAPYAQEAIMRSPLGGELTYALCQDPELCTRLAQLPPQNALYELGKLEYQLEQRLGTATSTRAHSAGNGSAARPSRGPVSQAKPRTRASEPITPLAPGTSASTPDLETMSLDDYRKMRIAQIRGGR